MVTSTPTGSSKNGGLREVRETNVPIVGATLGDIMPRMAHLHQDATNTHSFLPRNRLVFSIQKP